MYFDASSGSSTSIRYETYNNTTSTYDINSEMDFTKEYVQIKLGDSDFTVIPEGATVSKSFNVIQDLLLGAEGEQVAFKRVSGGYDIYI